MPGNKKLIFKSNIIDVMRLFSVGKRIQDHVKLDESVKKLFTEINSAKLVCEAPMD